MESCIIRKNWYFLKTVSDHPHKKFYSKQSANNSNNNENIEEKQTRFLILSKISEILQTVQVDILIKHVINSGEILPITNMQKKVNYIGLSMK